MRVRSWPSKSRVPEVGRSSVPRICKKVDLPTPEAPRTATISPGSMRRSMPRRTSMRCRPCRKDFRRSRISTRGAGHEKFAEVTHPSQGCQCRDPGRAWVGCLASPYPDGMADVCTRIAGGSAARIVGLQLVSHQGSVGHGHAETTSSHRRRRSRDPRHALAAAGQERLRGGRSRRRRAKRCGWPARRCPIW